MQDANAVILLRMTSVKVESVNARTFRSARAKPLRVADNIAAALREGILNGTLDGILPKQDELMEMFGVSGPSLREALRVLETEGLLTVRRGKIGGAAVHRPDGGSVAHAVGLTLQGDRTQLNELAESVLAFEPTCAGACARREDRLESISPRLDENVARTADTLGDGPEFTRLSREFHALVVECTPNPALRLMVRSLVAVWSIQEENWADELSEAGKYPDIEGQKAALKAHQVINERIRSGDAEAAERAARQHLTATQKLILEQFGTRIVDAVSPRATEGFRNLSNRERNWTDRQVI